jgi:hypothetical protein
VQTCSFSTIKTFEKPYGSCWENPYSLVDCQFEEDYCMDEIITDWFPKGEQIAQIRRGCSKTEAPINCSQGGTDRIKYKDCLRSCSGIGCNYGLEVGDKFLGSYQQDKCITCKYIEHDDGTVDGNKNCVNNLDSFVKECPNYASVGCYTGAAAHNLQPDSPGNLINEIYKGCSTFTLINGFEAVNASLPGENGAQAYSITKTSCQGTNCNTQHLPPTDPEGPGMLSALFLLKMVFSKKLY